MAFALEMPLDTQPVRVGAKEVTQNVNASLKEN